MSQQTTAKRKAVEDLLGLPEGTLKGKPNYAPGGKNTNRNRNVTDPSVYEGKTFDQIMAILPARKAKFVQATIAGKSGRAAIQDAGWMVGDKAANARAYTMKNRDIGVMAAIDAARREMAASAKYTLESAFNELSEALAEARRTDNATAYVRAVEIRAKLLGLLVDRADVRNLSALTIQIEGMETSNNR